MIYFKKMRKQKWAEKKIKRYMVIIRIVNAWIIEILELEKIYITEYS